MMSTRLELGLGRGLGRLNEGDEIPNDDDLDNNEILIEPVAKTTIGAVAQRHK